MFKEYDVVELVENLSERLKVGTRGAIVMIYPGQSSAFEVEFVDSGGHTIEVRSVKADQVKLVQSASN